MPDYYRIELVWFFAIAAALAAVAPAVVFWPRLQQLGFVFLFGPELAAALWIATIVLAFRVHRWRGLWLVITAIIIVPTTYVHAALVWGCVLTGNCL